MKLDQTKIVTITIESLEADTRPQLNVLSSDSLTAENI